MGAVSFKYEPRMSIYQENRRLEDTAMIKFLALLWLFAASSNATPGRVAEHPHHPEQRSIVCGFSTYCLVDDMCTQYGSGLYCDIINQCCFPKVPNGGPCPMPGIGGAICQSGNCVERFPFWKIFLWPPAALSWPLGTCQ